MDWEGDAAVFFVMFYLLIMLAVRIFDIFLADETIIRKLINQYVEDPMSSDIYIAPKKNWTISVIYSCESNAQVVREQITCLSHVISKTFPGRVNAEFLCFVSDDWKDMWEPLQRVSNSLQSMRLFRIHEKNPVLRFALGSMYARSRIIVDARQLCNEIDYITANPDVEFVRFMRDENIPECPTLPISGTKPSLVKIFRNLHLTGPGSFCEMDLLARVNSVETEVIDRQGIDPCTLGWWYRIRSFLWAFVMRQMYYNRMWSISIDVIC